MVTFLILSAAICIGCWLSDFLPCPTKESDK